MLEHGINHLPVTGADGLVAGVVSETDLMGLERSVPFTFLRAIDRAETSEEVVARMSQLPAIVIPLVETEADPVDIGHVIASAIDATTRRLITSRSPSSAVARSVGMARSRERSPS